MITVEKPRESDIKDIFEIEQQAFSLPWTLEMFKEHFHDKRAITLVARENDEVVGYVTAHYVLDEGYLDNIAVKAGMRASGIGTKIMTELIKICGELKLDFLTLEVRESNSVAQRLYRKMGMKEVGHRKDFYFKPQEDAILMTIEFNK